MKTFRNGCLDHFLSGSLTKSVGCIFVLFLAVVFEVNSLSFSAIISRENDANLFVLLLVYNVLDSGQVDDVKYVNQY